MELLKNNELGVSVIRRSGQRVHFSPMETEWNVIEEEIQNAMKEKAEIRWYYLPKVNLEIIRTTIPPGYEQPWHSHFEIREAMMVLKGQVIVSERRQGKVTEELLTEKEFVVFSCGQYAFHTMKNPSESYTHTLTYKFPSSGAKNKRIFETDWHPLSQSSSYIE